MSGTFHFSFAVLLQSRMVLLVETAVADGDAKGWMTYVTFLLVWFHKTR
jgi:hypothetical protein